MTDLIRYRYWSDPSDETDDDGNVPTERTRSDPEDMVDDFDS